MRKPGWPRRLVSLGIVLGTTTASALLFLLGIASDLEMAAAIFLISLLGFSTLARTTFDSVNAWRAVDYPWVCVSFVTVMVALIGISDGARRQRIADAKTDFSAAFSALIYATKSTITNDCNSLPTRVGSWSKSPEPYHGACDRIAHFLPQMELELYSIDRSPGKLVTTNEWGRDMAVPEAANALGGNWQYLYLQSETFSELRTAYYKVIQDNPAPSDRLRSFLLSTSLQDWYFFLAFFVGLRLSRTTAELLQARQAERDRRRANVTVKVYVV